MSIERALIAMERIADALTAIAANTQPVTGLSAQAEAPKQTAPEATAPAPEAKKRERPAKATGVKTDAPTPAPTPEPTPEPEAPAPEVMDYEVLKRAVIEVGSYSEQGRQRVIALLGEFGVKNAKDIQPELREEFHAAVLNALTELQNAESGDGADEEFA